MLDKTTLVSFFDKQNKVIDLELAIPSLTLMVHVRILVVIFKMIVNLNIHTVMFYNNSLLVMLQLINPAAAMLFFVHKMDIIKELNNAIAVLDVTDIFNMIGMIILMVDKLTMIDITILKTDVILI